MLRRIKLQVKEYKSKYDLLLNKEERDVKDEKIDLDEYLDSLEKDKDCDGVPAKCTIL